MDTNNPPVSLGTTAIDVWRTWRSLPWQGMPTYGNALGCGEYCWQLDRSTPSGFSLHRVVNALATRPATAHEEEDGLELPPDRGATHLQPAQWHWRERGADPDTP